MTDINGDSGASTLTPGDEIVSLPEEISWEPYPGGGIYEEDCTTVNSKKKKCSYEESPTFHDLK